MQALEASCHWAAWAVEQGIIAPDDVRDTAQAATPDGRQHMLAALQTWLDGLDEGQGDDEPREAAGNEKDMHQLAFRLLVLMTLVGCTYAMSAAVTATHFLLPNYFAFLLRIVSNICKASKAAQCTCSCRTQL